MLMVCVILKQGDFFVADVGSESGYIILPGGPVGLEESQHDAALRVLRDGEFGEICVHQGRMVYHAGFDGRMCETILFYGDFPVETPLPKTGVLMSAIQLREMSPLASLYTDDNLNNTGHASLTVDAASHGDLSEVISMNAAPPVQLVESVCVIVERDDKYLAHVNEKTGRPELPGGHVEKGESIWEAGARELNEETGAEINPLLTDAIPGRKIRHLGRNGLWYNCSVILCRGGVKVPDDALWLTREELRAQSLYAHLYTDEFFEPPLDSPFTRDAPRTAPPDPSAFDPKSDEERLLASLFVEEPNLHLLAEKLAQFTTVTPLADYRGKDASPRMHLARLAELFGRSLTEKDEEIAALKAKIEEYESGEEVTRLKGCWREWEIEAGKAHAVLTSIINALDLDDSNPTYPAYTFTGDKGVFESIEREHSDFPYFFDRLFKRNRG